jgi:hypothetical protein
LQLIINSAYVRMIPVTIVVVFLAISIIFLKKIMYNEV